MNTGYRGRFAPSPTGPLHFGSLVSAVCSYLDARSAGGTWSVRIEDIDPPREVPGATTAILKTLEAFEMAWDGPVLYQSTRMNAYLEALKSLKEQNKTYHCSCSRKDILAINHDKPNVTIYPGTCRNQPCKPDTPTTTRLRIHDRPLISFTDRQAGKQTQDLQRQVGDFIIQRNNGLIAYQLAVVVDDAYQGITDIVRGHDLLDNSARQIYLQQQLLYPTPRYLHHPVAVDSLQHKLSKQSFAPAIQHSEKQELLYTALVFLGQSPPEDIVNETLDRIWDWAISHWEPSFIPANPLQTTKLKL